jgi:mono/diheme cytochrome c family protein
LEASKVTEPPLTFTGLNSYWKAADYLLVTTSNASTNVLFTDGQMNMTGTYTGMNAFAGNPGLKLRAAYDDVNLYILAEWTDPQINMSFKNWYFNGPGDPLKSSETSNGWTSQRNSDGLAFAFEIDPASGPAGNFATVGCAASCHSSGINSNMRPDAGKVDFWNWSLARSGMGYVQDMVAIRDSLADDSGTKLYARNSTGTTNRTGPAFEWNGTDQTVTLVDGKTATLNPGFYLLEDHKTPFNGDIAAGNQIFHRATTPGECYSCHGNNGNGEGYNGDGAVLNIPFMNTKSRATLLYNMDRIEAMPNYWSGLNSNERENIVAYVRGLSGVPGYYLRTPSGSNADIRVLTNVTPINVRNASQFSPLEKTYQVLLIRKLKTNNTDDIQFDLSASTSYKFGIAIMNNDSRNHIGSKIETLNFK